MGEIARVDVNTSAALAAALLASAAAAAAPEPPLPPSVLPPVVVRGICALWFDGAVEGAEPTMRPEEEKLSEEGSLEDLEQRLPILFSHLSPPFSREERARVKGGEWGGDGRDGRRWYQG